MKGLGYPKLNYVIIYAHMTSVEYKRRCWKMFTQLFYVKLKWMVIYIVHESVPFGIIHVNPGVAARISMNKD